MDNKVCFLLLLISSLPGTEGMLPGSLWERVTKLIGEIFKKNQSQNISHNWRSISQELAKIFLKPFEKNILKELFKNFLKLTNVITKVMSFHFHALDFQQLLRFSLVLIWRSGLLWNSSRPLRQVEIAPNCEKNIFSRSNRLQTSSYCLNLILERPTIIS